MGVTVDKSSVDKLLARLQAQKEAINTAIVDALAGVGEYVSDKIRSGELSSWINDTGSLRSSVGYAVARRGKIVRMSDFATILNGSEGSRKGRERIAEAAAEYSTYDYVLIIIAGEDYAVYVEAVENKVVLSSGWLYIKKELVEILRSKVQEAMRGI